MVAKGLSDREGSVPYLHCIQGFGQLIVGSKPLWRCLQLGVRREELGQCLPEGMACERDVISVDRMHGQMLV
jgi:hypothetical protein